MFCAACGQPIFDEQWPSSYCWTDPDGITVAAHGHCLRPFDEIVEDMDLEVP